MRQSLPTELDTEKKIHKGISINSVLVMLVFLFIGTQLQERVYETLRIPFIIFNLIVGLLFCINSQTNKQKKFYQSILIMLFRDKTYYRPIPNPNELPNTIGKYNKRKGRMKDVEPKAEDE